MKFTDPNATEYIHYVAKTGHDPLFRFLGSYIPTEYSRTEVWQIDVLVGSEAEAPLMRITKGHQKGKEWVTPDKLPLYVTDHLSVFYDERRYCLPATSLKLVRPVSHHTVGEGCIRFQFPVERRIMRRNKTVRRDLKACAHNWLRWEQKTLTSVS
jgi:hypothetical protein